MAAALAARSARLQGLAARLRGLRLEPVVDAERLQVRAVVKTPGHAFELRGNRAEELRVSRVAPVGGKPYEVAASFPPVELGSLRERHRPRALAGGLALPHGRPRRPAAAARSGSELGVLAAAAQRHHPGGAPRRSSAGEAMLSPSAPLELMQEFQHGGTHYRFVAVRESGALFKGRLIGPGGDVWSDRFDLAHFPGTAAVVALGPRRAAARGRGRPPGPATRACRSTSSRWPGRSGS